MVLKYASIYGISKGIMAFDDINERSDQGYGAASHTQYTHKENSTKQEQIWSNMAK